MALEAAQSVLDFWFHPKDHPEFGKFQRKWFSSSSEFDEEIRSKFGDLVTQALDGSLQEEWEKTPESTIAHIILLDQFPRNIYRGDSMAFAGEPLAIQSAMKLLEHETDRLLPKMYRIFCYLPYMHAESVELQNQCISLFNDMRKDYRRLKTPPPVSAPVSEKEESSSTSNDGETPAANTEETKAEAEGEDSTKKVEIKENEVVKSVEEGAVTAGGGEEEWEEDKDVTGCLSFAKSHLDVVLRFGRFPKRNAALEREDTEEERQYLAEGGRF